MRGGAGIDLDVHPRRSPSVTPQARVRRAHKERNTRPRVSFHRWQLGLIDVGRVYAALDVGCGAGRMTRALRERLPPGALLTALDVDPRAAAAARAGGGVDVLRARAEALPLASGQFELVTAGHVLPSAAHLARAVAELRRALAPGGVVLASADSAASGRRLLDWHVDACRRAGRADQAARALAPSPRDRFTLENGARVLAAAFGQVETHARGEALVFGSADALLEVYLRGLLHARGLPPPIDRRALALAAADLGPHVRAIAAANTDADGRIVVPRRSGVLIARAD